MKKRNKTEQQTSTNLVLTTLNRGSPAYHEPSFRGLLPRLDYTATSAPPTIQATPIERVSAPHEPSPLPEQRKSSNPPSTGPNRIWKTSPAYYG